MDADKPKKKFYKQWWFWVIVVLVIVVLAESGNSSSSAPATATAPTTETAAQTTTTPTQTAPAKQAVAPVKTTPTATPAPAPAPHVPVALLQISGTGQKSTQTFTAPSNWTLDYSYDCSNFGYKGNFQIYIYNADGSPASADGPNELGMSGSDTEYYHSGGQLYLEVNSECSWTVTAKG